MSSQGAWLGLAAGAIFALAEALAARAGGASPLLVLRYAASVVLGSRALSEPLGVVVPAGLGVHFVLSVTWGFLYMWLHRLWSSDVLRSWPRRLGGGLLFGACIWLLDVHLVARLFFPWFLALDQPLQGALHACAFGLPLAILIGVGERARLGETGATMSA